MKTVAIEELIVGTVLTFCENAAELGCPKDQEVDMWFRYLSYEEQLKVADKMLAIEERNAKIYKEEDMSKKESKESKELKEPKEKIIKMCQIELDLDEKTIKGLCKYALKEIKNDRDALINYAANKMLAEIVETDGECLKSSDE